MVKIGDKVTSTNPETKKILMGIVIDIDYNGLNEPVHLLVKQNNGITAYWGA